MGKLLSTDGVEDFVNIVVYGKSGSGKTTLGVTAPKPFVLLSERQGYRSIRDAAEAAGVPVPPTLYLETVDDLRACLAALKGGSDEPIAVALRECLLPEKYDGHGKANNGKGNLVPPSDEEVAEVEEAIASLPYLKPETIVCDSITDFFVLVSDDILNGMGNPVSSTDGLEVKPERYWGLLKDRSERLLRTIRDLPYNILFLCLLDDREVGKDESRQRVVGPDTPMRKLPSTLLASSNACGLAFVEQHAVKQEVDQAATYQLSWRVRFAGPSWMTVKPIKPLRDVEEPHFGRWLEQLRSGERMDPVDPNEHDLARQNREALGLGDQPDADEPEGTDEGEDTKHVDDEGEPVAHPEDDGSDKAAKPPSRSRRRRASSGEGASA